MRDYAEKSNRRMVAIIAVLLLLIAYKCSSQSNRDYPNPMRFSCGKFDTLYVSIEHEVAFDVYHLTFSCTSHEHLDIKSITIGFEDGEDVEVFREFGWIIENEKKFKEIKFDFLSFDKEFSSAACLNIRTKDYFIKYFDMVQK